MRKSRPKSAMRPGSAVAKRQVQESESIIKKNVEGKEKISYEKAKQFINKGNNSNNLLFLQKGPLLPILSAYEPRILKHIIISEEKQTNNNNRTLSRSTNISTQHKNCEIHQINIKTIISYFIEWKRVVKGEIEEFENMLGEVREGVSNEEVKRIREEIVSRLEKIKGINTLMGKQLETYIETEAEHYIQERIQSHLEHPPNKPQPISKESLQLISEKNHNKIAQIYKDYEEYKTLTNAILGIFYSMEEVIKVRNEDEKDGELIGGIVFERVEKELENIAKMNNTKQQEQSNLLQKYIQQLCQQLWPIVQKRIDTAFTMCNNTNFKEEEESNSFLKSNTNIKTKSTKNFMAVEKLVKTSSSNNKVNRRRYFESTINMIKRQETIIMNLNFVEFKLKKLFPLLLTQVIETIRHEVEYKRVLSEYKECLCQVIVDINANINNSNMMSGDEKPRQNNDNLYREERMYKTYEWFIGMQNTLQERITLFSNKFVYYGQQREEQKKEQFTNTTPTTTMSTSSINHLHQEINFLIKLTKHNLELLFILLIKQIIYYLKEEEKEQSVLGLVHSEGKVYKMVKEIMVRMSEMMMMEWGVGMDTKSGDKNINGSSSTFSSSIELVNFLTISLREYSPLLQTLLSIEVDLNIIVKHNTIPITNNSTTKLPQYHETTIQLTTFFNDIKELIETFLSTKEAIINYLQQNIINKWVNNRCKLMKEKYSEIGYEELLQEKLQLLSTFVENLEKVIEENAVGETKSIKNNDGGVVNSNNSSKELHEINSFIELINKSQSITQEMLIFANPQQYIKELITTESTNLFTNNTSNNLLTHPKLLSTIYQLNTLYKQFMTVLSSSELIQFVIKEREVKDIMIGKMIVGEGQYNDGSSNIGFFENLFKFPTVPMILNPTSEHINPQQNTNLSTINISINKILTTLLPLHSIPLITKSHQNLQQLHKLVGDTIDSLEEFQELTKFNEELQEEILKIKEVWHCDKVITFINEMVNSVISEWQTVMKWNEFKSNIDLKMFIKMLRCCDYEQKHPNTERTNKYHKEQFELIKTYIKDLYKQALSIEEFEVNKREELKTNNKIVELLKEIEKALELLNKHKELKVLINEFLSEIHIKIKESRININTKERLLHKDNNHLQQVNKQNVINENILEPKLVILYQPNNNKIKKRIINNYQQQSYETTKPEILLSQEVENKFDKNNINRRVEVDLRLSYNDVIGLLVGYLPEMLLLLNNRVQNKDSSNNNTNNNNLNKNCLEMPEYEMEYICHYFTSTEQLVVKIVEHQQQSPKPNPNKNHLDQDKEKQYTTNKLIFELNEQLLHLVKLLSKPFVEYSDLFKEETVKLNNGLDNNDNNNILETKIAKEKIIEQLEEYFASTLNKLIQSEHKQYYKNSNIKSGADHDGYLYINDDSDYENKNNNYYVEFIKVSKELQYQETPISNNNEPVSIVRINNNAYICEKQQQQNRNKLFMQLNNLLQFMVNYNVLRNKELHFIVIKLEQEQKRKSEKHVIEKCFNIIVRKSAKEEEYHSPEKILQFVDNSLSCQIGVDGSDGSSCSEFVKEKVSNKIIINNNNNNKKNDYLSEQLSLRYFRSCCQSNMVNNSLTQFSYTTGVHNNNNENNNLNNQDNNANETIRFKENNYLTIITINPDKLLKEFILKELMINNKLLMSLSIMDVNVNEGDNNDNVGMFEFVREIIKLVNLQQQQLKKSKRLSSSQSLLSNNIEEQQKQLTNYINLVRHFYRNHYKVFISYCCCEENHNHNNNNNIESLLEEMLSVWDRLLELSESSYLSVIVSDKKDDSRISTTILSVEELYDIIKKLLSCESRLYEEYQNKFFEQESEQKEINQVTTTDMIFDQLVLMRIQEQQEEKENESVLKKTTKTKIKTVGILLAKEKDIIPHVKNNKNQPAKTLTNKKSASTHTPTTIKRHNEKELQTQQQQQYENKLSLYEQYLLEDYYWSYSQTEEQVNEMRLLLEEKEFGNEFDKSVMITDEQEQSSSKGITKEQKEHLNHKYLNCLIKNKFIILDLMPLSKELNSTEKQNNSNNNNNNNNKLLLEKALYEYFDTVYKLKQEELEINKLSKEIKEVVKYKHFKEHLIIERNHNKNNIDKSTVHEQKPIVELSTELKEATPCLYVLESILSVNENNENNEQKANNLMIHDDIFSTKHNIFEANDKEQHYLLTTQEIIDNLKELESMSKNILINEENEEKKSLIEILFDTFFVNNNNNININDKEAKTKNKYDYNSSRQEWWERITISTLIHNSSRERRQLENKQQQYEVQNNLIGNNKEKQLKLEQSEESHIEIIQLISTFTEENNLYVEEEYKWLEEKEKLSDKTIRKQITMFSQFVEKLIHLLETEVRTKMFIPMIEVDEMTTIEHVIKLLAINQSSIKKSQSQQLEQSENEQPQPIVLLQSLPSSSQTITSPITPSPFTIIHSPITITNTNITNEQQPIEINSPSELLQIIFHEYLITHNPLINKSHSIYESETTTLNELITQKEQSKQKLIQFYNSLNDELKRDILKWSKNKIEHEKEYKLKINKERSIKILLMILVEWGELIVNNRLNREKELLEEKERLRRREQEKKYEEEQERLRKEEEKKEKQNKNNNNSNKKQKSFLHKTSQIHFPKSKISHQQEQEPSESEKEELEIEFALSDAWTVDRIEFISELPENKKQQFYKVEKKLIEKEQEEESELEISVNLSENNHANGDSNYLTQRLDDNFVRPVSAISTKNNNNNHLMNMLPVSSKINRKNEEKK